MPLIRRLELGQVAQGQVGTLGIGHYIAGQTARFPSSGSDWPLVSEIILFAGNFAPAGTYSTVGGSLPNSTERPLQTAIGSAFGVSGTSFVLPNLAGRVAFGSGTR